MRTVEVRELDDGEWCVDLGRKWFRIHANGSVTTKQARRGAVATRGATKAETAFAHKELAARLVVHADRWERAGEDHARLVNDLRTAADALRRS